MIYPLGWQLDQYQYNDDNKEGQGIFRRTFNPNVGEMRVSLETHNPPPCNYTYAYKNGAEIKFKLNELGENLRIIHNITFDKIGGEDRLEVEINCRELLEALQDNGTHTKNIGH